VRNHFKAYTRATWNAGRAARGGDFAAADRWDRYAERQLKLASLRERALDAATLRRENDRLDIAALHQEKHNQTDPYPAERHQVREKLDDLIARMDREIAEEEARVQAGEEQDGQQAGQDATQPAKANSC